MKRAQLLKVKAQVSSIWGKGYILMIVCVVSDLTFFQRSHDRGSLSAVSLVICSPARIAVCNTWSSGGTALCRVGGAISQLDLPSLPPLSVAGCG